MSSAITFPDASPQDITIVDIHHDPLTVQRIFVYRSVEEIRNDQWTIANVHIAPGVIARNISTLCDMVIRTSVWAESRTAARRRSLNGILQTPS
jgi:hypothetical protein